MIPSNPAVQKITGEGVGHLRSWRAAFAVVLFLVGFLLIVQLRADEGLRASFALPSRRLADLAVLVRRQQDADRTLRAQVAALEAKQRQIVLTQAQGRSLAGAMRHELEAYREQLGLTAVHGPGLRVVLAAGPHRLAVPQAQDVAGVANELWAAGAEAVAVNGIRVLATDGFDPMPRGLRVAGRAAVDPYAITAIGDPAAFEGALLVPGGAVAGLRGVGLTVTLARVGNAVLPAYGGRLHFEFARPAGGP